MAHNARYSVSRRKACQQCASGRTRCDKNPRGCLRCMQRGVACLYANPGAGASSPARCEAPPLSTPNTGSVLSPAMSEPSPSLLWLAVAADSHHLPANGQPSPSSTHTGPSTTAKRRMTEARMTDGGHEDDSLYFSYLDLICPIHAESMGTRWMNAYLPDVTGDGPPAKEYPPHIADLISRVLDSYARSASRGGGIPSFLHWTQQTAGVQGLSSSSSSLATSLSIVRICDPSGPAAGGAGSSNAALAEVLKLEMERLYDEVQRQNAGSSDTDGRIDGFDNGEERDRGDLTLLPQFQAHLIYLLVLYFRLENNNDNSADHDNWFSFFGQATSNLDEIAAAAAKRGIACAAEIEGRRTRPRWESWIVAEAKRRTVYVMYLFENVLSRRRGLATLLGTELSGLLAPGSKVLWEARTRREWEARYNEYLAEWGEEGGLRIEELWGNKGLLDGGEMAIRKRKERVDRWLEGVDEFGMTIYVVTSGTHGA